MKFIIFAALFICSIYQVLAGGPSRRPSFPFPPPSNSIQIHKPVCIYCKDFMENEYLIPTTDCNPLGNTIYPARVVTLKPTYDVLYTGYCIGYYKVKRNTLPRGDDWEGGDDEYIKYFGLD